MLCYVMLCDVIKYYIILPARARNAEVQVLESERPRNKKAKKGTILTFK